METTQNSSQKSQRLQSLDALRGCDMFLIMGGSWFISSICGLFPNSDVAHAIAGQMEHVKWDGFAVYDMIFPLFLFIAGISFPYSLANRRAKGLSDKGMYWNIVRRGFTLLLLGLYLNGLFWFNFETMRFGSVLGRIGLAWMFAALIFVNTKTTTRIAIVSVLLIGYWLALALIPVPGAAGLDPFSMEGSLVGYVDRTILPGALYLKDAAGNSIHDPEGIFSTIPAIATALLGMFTGEYVRLNKASLTPTKKALYMFAAGIVLLVIGKVWSIWFPINKNLWTSSFVCFVGGLSLMAFAVFYYIIDVRNWRSWTLFFVVIGMNSITIYLVKAVINMQQIANSVFAGTINLFPEVIQPVLSSFAYVMTCWVLLYFLYKKKIFLKV